MFGDVDDSERALVRDLLASLSRLPDCARSFDHRYDGEVLAGQALVRVEEDTAPPFVAATFVHKAIHIRST